MKAFSLRRETDKDAHWIPLLYNIALKVLASVIKQEKWVKGKRIEKEEIKLSFLADDMIMYIENPKE